MSFTNYARPTFETIKKGDSSSDYLKNKKSKLSFCNGGGGCGRLNKSNSYNEKNLFNNGKLLNEIVLVNGINPNHKYDLINNLFSTMDLTDTLIITDVINNEPTCIDISLIPFYESYNIDTNSSLFGSSECDTNNYVHYMTENLDYVAPPTVLFNRST